MASAAVPLRPGPRGRAGRAPAGAYWPEEEPGLRLDEAAQGAGLVPFKVWARTEDAALSPDGVWQGEANSPDCTKHSKSGVFAEPTSPEWREVVSGPKPKNFHKAKHAGSPISVYNRFEALQDEPTHEFVSVLRQACVDGMASHEAELIQVVEKLEAPRTPWCSGRQNRR